MDGWDIADALMRGRRVATAKLRMVSRNGDGADQLYVWLYQAIVERQPLSNVISAIRTTCPHQPTAEAWVYITRYASEPTGSNFVKLAAAAAKGDNSAGTIVRLSPLVLMGPHRRKFARLVAELNKRGREIGADLDELSFDLCRFRGPSKLRAT